MSVLVVVRAHETKMNACKGTYNSGKTFFYRFLNAAQVHTSLRIAIIKSQNHRIAEVGKELKDHQAQPQPNHTTLTTLH